MGLPVPYQPHKLIVGLLAAREVDVALLVSRVERDLGTVDARSEVMPFEFTRYYEDEMGPGIRRQLLSMGELVDPIRLAEFKMISNDIEKEFTDDQGRRRVNVDPGLLSLSRVILATTKPSAHRIPIGRLIHAEITLIYCRGAYRPLQWTYPDFQSDAYTKWLKAVREVFHEQLREIDPTHPWRL